MSEPAGNNGLGNTPSKIGSENDHSDIQPATQQALRRAVAFCHAHDVNIPHPGQEIGGGNDQENAKQSAIKRLSGNDLPDCCGKPILTAEF